MLIQQLPQKQTDELMKSLEGIYFRNWLNAFHEEKTNLDGETAFVALPENKRIYFTVESYLIGINSDNSIGLSLSSFARVLAAHPTGNCAMCLSALFKKRLFSMCRQQGKSLIIAYLEPDGVRVFKELQAVIPAIQLSPGFYWKAIVPVPL